jgi:capsular polysaccharide biosynthesis protein
MAGTLLTKTVSFDELVCAPLLRESRFLSNIEEVRIGDEGPPVHVARAEDVLYLPDRGLQIVRDRFVPLEATPYPGALAYVQKASVTDGKGRYEHPVGCCEVDEQVCILANIWSYNLYHWIEELLKAIILETYGFKGRYILSGIPNFAAEFLEVLGVSPARIVRDHFDKPAVFRSVMLTTPINLMYDVVYYKNVFLALRKALLASVDRSGPAPYTERVWLARGVKALNGRRIVNAEDVDKVLTRFGFQVVDMGTMPARGQIAVSSRARCLGGVHGAAFVHTMFLAEYSTVIECFSPEYVHPCMLGVCRHLNHRYFQIVFDNFDKYAYGHDVMINCAHLELVLRSLETGGYPPDRNGSWRGALSRFAHTCRLWSSRR